MRRNRFLSISVGSCLLLLSVVASAGWFAADFSAEVVLGTSQGQRPGGKMFVSHGRVRTEMEQNGASVIEIIDPVAGYAWFIEPTQKRYRERVVPKLTQGVGPSSNPCHGISGAECRQLADETVQGRRAQKWMMRFGDKERLQWQDALHGFPIQIVEGGRVVMTMAFLGEDDLHGRRTEHWRAIQYQAEGTIESEQWYDPQLNIAVRQQAPDGSFRELQNIRLGEQKEELFTKPERFTRIDDIAH